jgi:hypothetical protein
MRSDAADAAVGIIAASRAGTGVDTAAVAQRLNDLGRRNPALAQEARTQVEARMTPVERGELARRMGANDRAGLARAGPDPATLALDVGQMALDVVGIFDPTPISDGTNAVISLFRGDFAGAGISALGILPGIGDAAKLGKLGKWAETVANAVDLAARNPAFAARVEPALRRIADAIGSAPLDKLPASARETLQRIKAKIDGLAAARASAGLRNADGSLNLANAAARYGEVIGSNKPWSWADDFGPARFTAGERAQIRAAAIERGLIPDVAMKPGTRYPDFAGAGLVRRTDQLPGNLWHASDKAQFDYLDARIPGGRPEGMTWHHTETPGRMELVPFGAHNVYNHIGGRSPGHWAHAPR